MKHLQTFEANWNDELGTNDTLTKTEETITYEIAKEYLATSSVNRSDTVSRIKRYAADMIQGKWKLNGESVSFDSEGHLRNGHHRLKSVIYAKEVLGYNVSFKTLVVRGIEPDTFPTIDTGRCRSGGDILSINGHKNGNKLAAAYQWLFRYHFKVVSRNETMTNDELLEVARVHPNLVESVIRTEKTNSNLLRASYFATLHYLFSRIDEVAASRFFTCLSSGVDLGVNSPVLLLRERLLANVTGKNKLPVYDIIALVIKAWNAFQAGRPLTTLRWRSSGPNPEIFPIINDFPPSAVEWTEDCPTTSSKVSRMGDVLTQ